MVNSTTLYSAVEMSDADRAQAMESGDLLRVVKTARPLIQMAIEQNLTVDIFGDDLDIGGDGELPLGQKSEHVKSVGATLSVRTVHAHRWQVLQHVRRPDVLEEQANNGH